MYLTLWEVVENDKFELPIGIYSSWHEARAHRPRDTYEGSPHSKHKYVLRKVIYKTKKEYEDT